MLFFDKLQDTDSMLQFKGTVATVGDLPSSATVGDFYNVSANGHFYGWEGSEWEDIGTGLKGVLSNTATGSYSLTIEGNSSTTTSSTNVGANSSAYGWYATAYGCDAIVGTNSNRVVGAIQLGRGNTTENGVFNVGLSTDGRTFNNYKLLNASGKIPAERIDGFATSTNLTSEINDRQEADDDLQTQIDAQNPTTYAGYDATKTQILKSIQGILTWVDEV